MSAPSHPAVAASLLERVHVDPALVGDILEQYAHRRSRLWLWRQVIGAVTLALIGRGGAPRPHVRRDVRLTATPTGSPVGGLGLLALAILVSVVVPDVWWVLAASAVGGTAIGAGLIAVRRRRARHAMGRRTIFVVTLLAVTTVSSGARGEEQRGPAIGLDPVKLSADANGLQVVKHSSSWCRWIVDIPAQ